MNNKLVEAASRGRPPTYWRAALYFIAALGLPLIATLPVTICLVLVLMALQITPTPDDMTSLVTGDLFFYGVGGLFEILAIAVSLLWVRWIDRRPVTSIGLTSPRPLWEWARGMLVGAGLMLLAVGSMALLGFVRVDGSALANPVGLLSIAGTLFFYLIQGPAEEVVFRGYMLPVLSARSTIVVGTVISSILFGLLHILNPHVGPLPIINITLAGVAFALYALVEEGLWGVFGLHSAWNWVQGNVLGLPVSGGVYGPSLLRLREAGPDWLTGGAFGPEGSLLVTVLLAALSLGLGWRLWRKSKTQPADGQDAGAS